MTNLLGETAALSCSLLWALCSLAFASAGRRVGASPVNQIRIHMALVALFALHVTIEGSIWPVGLSGRQLGLLSVSGVIGLSLGDLCLFRCMVSIGPRLGTLLLATTPVMTALIAWVVLDEVLRPVAILGMGFVIAGVVAVLFDRSGTECWVSDRPIRRWVAVLLGLAGALGQAVGLILAKDAMIAADAGETDVVPLSATLVRMAAGAGGVVVVAVLSRQVGSTLRAVRDGPAMRATAIGTVFGPILGVWMSAVAVRLAPAGIAAALMSLAPILMIPIGRIAYGARPGPLGILGTAIAVGGGAALFLT